MCAIFRDCQLRCVGAVRGASLPSPIDLTCRFYNTGHTTYFHHLKGRVYNTEFILYRRLFR